MTSTSTPKAKSGSWTTVTLPSPQYIWLQTLTSFARASRLWWPRPRQHPTTPNQRRHLPLRSAHGPGRLGRGHSLAAHGIAFSPDQRTLYLTDTGAGEVIISTHISPPPRWNSTNLRPMYAYDVTPSGKGLLNKRTIHHAMKYVPDDIKHMG